MGLSRNENILENMLGANNPVSSPMSREEKLLTEINDELKTNAKTDGIYENMVSGRARSILSDNNYVSRVFYSENMVGDYSRNSVINDVYSYISPCDTLITNNIQGLTVCWNQLVDNHHSSGGDYNITIPSGHIYILRRQTNIVDGKAVYEDFYGESTGDPISINGTPVAFDKDKDMLFDISLMFNYNPSVINDTHNIAYLIKNYEMTSSGKGRRLFRSLFSELYYSYDPGTVRSVCFNKKTLHGPSNATKTISNKLYADVIGGYTYKITGEYTDIHFLTNNDAPILVEIDSNGEFTPMYNCKIVVTLISGKNVTIYPKDYIDSDHDYKASTSYEYKSPVVLRGLGEDTGGYSDVYHPDGTIDRRVVEYTFDGSNDENWHEQTFNENDPNNPVSKLFSIALDKPIQMHGLFINNKYLVDAEASTYGYDPGIYLQLEGSSETIVFIRPENASDMSMSDFRQWLLNSPLTVAYPVLNNYVTVEKAEPYQAMFQTSSFQIIRYVDYEVSTNKRDVSIPSFHSDYLYKNIKAKLEDYPNLPSNLGRYELLKNSSGVGFTPSRFPDYPNGPEDAGDWDLTASVNQGGEEAYSSWQRRYDPEPYIIHLTYNGSTWESDTTIDDVRALYSQNRRLQVSLELEDVDSYLELQIEAGHALFVFSGIDPINDLLYMAMIGPDPYGIVVKAYSLTQAF